MILLRSLLAVMFTSVLISTAAWADIPETYENIREGYGALAEHYTKEVTIREDTKTNLVYITGRDAVPVTEVNVRTGPDAGTNRVTTIGTDARVKVWGVCENGWAQVYVQDADKSFYSGYIKKDLLDLPPQPEAKSDTEEKTQEE